MTAPTQTRIYLDNAATTPILPEVLEVMLPYFTHFFGNPSSIYSYGRETRMAVENARKNIASLLGCLPKEIFFTSCGTESTNTALLGALEQYGCHKIITSPVEHHATLHATERAALRFNIPVEHTSLLTDGSVDLEALDNALSRSDENCLVTLMHGNNEIGSLTDIEAIGTICGKHHAVFHCDAVQTIGHFPFQLNKLNIHFVSASAHKFHGPKGVGLLYINHQSKIPPFITGGSQERNMRAGTENVYGIVGMAKALEISMRELDKDKHYISSLKKMFRKMLEETFGNKVVFNGTQQEDKALYTLLSVGFPKNDKTELLLYNMDLRNICVSGGSACSSGANQGSHVLQHVAGSENYVTLRFSFSKLNTKEELKTVIENLKELV